MSSNALAVVDAALDLLATTFPDALTSFGPPGMDLPNDIAAVTGFRIENDTPTAGGPRRSVEETLSLTIILSAYRPGGDEVAREAVAAAFAMYQQIVAVLRDRSVATLGGLVREALVTDADCPDLAYKVPDPQTGQILGRCGEITVTLTCKTRI